MVMTKFFEFTTWPDVEEVNLDAKNSKVANDLRVIQSTIESKIESGDIDMSQIILLPAETESHWLIWNIYTWVPNYNLLELEKIDMLDAWNNEYKVWYTKIGDQQIYQILGFIRGNDWLPVEVKIIWNRLLSSIHNSPKSLFKKWDSSDYYENGEYLLEKTVTKKQESSNWAKECKSARLLSSSIEIWIIKQEISSKDDIVKNIIKDHSTQNTIWVIWKPNFEKLGLQEGDCGSAVIAYYKKSTDIAYFQISMNWAIAWNYVALDGSYPKTILSK